MSKKKRGVIPDGTVEELIDTSPPGEDCFVIPEAPPPEAQAPSPDAVKAFTAAQEAEILEAQLSDEERAELKRFTEGMQVEAYEEPPKPAELYICDKGHEQMGNGETVGTNHHTGKKVSTGNVCVECQLRDLGRCYPTQKATPKHVKKSRQKAARGA